MMKHKRSLYPGFQIGTSLLLVVLMALCLLVFSALSLSSAIRDYEYSKKLAVKTKEYYEANSKANQELKNLIDNNAQGIHSFEIPMNDTRSLSVSLVIEDDSYHIIKWKEVSSETWENDDKLPVLGSEQEE